MIASIPLCVQLKNRPKFSNETKMSLSVQNLGRIIINSLLSSQIKSTKFFFNPKISIFCENEIIMAKYYLFHMALSKVFNIYNFSNCKSKKKHKLISQNHLLIEHLGINFFS